jgi:undecaprenyl-diphosphatase
MMSTMWGRVRRLVVHEHDDAARRRRPGDAVRVVLAALLFLLLALHAGHYFKSERTFTRFLLDLPNDLHSLARLAYDLLALWALGIVVFGAVLARRWRLARDVAVAGALAWFLGRLLSFYVHHADLGHAFSVTFGTKTSPSFPLVRVELAVAVIAVAGRYLTRPVRWVGRSLVIALGIVAMYLGRGYLTDLLGAVVLGWGVANAVRYLFGTPIGRPTVAQVQRALDRLGVAVTGLRLAPDQPVGRALFLAERAGDGTALRIVALGRDEADAQLVARTWRYVAYRDSAPTLFPTRRQQIEYEAFTCLLAADAGARVTHIVAEGAVGPLAVLVQAEPDGARLADVEPAAVTDALLDEVWRQAGLLHAARIVHGALDARHLVVDDGQVGVVGWGRAVSGAGTQATAHDQAQLLAATAAIVGPDRAVAAAGRALTPTGLTDPLPFLQAAALTGTTRDALDHDDGIDDALERLREETAAAAGTAVPELRNLYRVHPRQVLMAVGALVGVGVLLSRVGDPETFWNSIRDATWWYVALAFVLGMLCDVAFAFAFLGTVPVRIALWPAVELQISLAFANLAVPLAADTALQVRFLQKNGLDLSESVATGGVLSTVSELVVQVGLFVLALWLSPDSIDFGHIDTNQIVVIVLIVIFLVGIATALVFSVQRIRRTVLPPVARALRAVWDAVKSPVRILLMIAGNVAAQLLAAATLLCCLAAFGTTVDFWTLVAVNIGISLISSLVPIPGGGTAVAVIGTSGLLVALGVSHADAAAAVLSQKLVVNYIPAIPGWFATNDLVRRGLL